MRTSQFSNEESSFIHTNVLLLPPLVFHTMFFIIHFLQYHFFVHYFSAHVLSADGEPTSTGNGVHVSQNDKRSGHDWVTRFLLQLNAIT